MIVATRPGRASECGLQPDEGQVEADEEQILLMELKAAWEPKLLQGEYPMASYASAFGWHAIASNNDSMLQATYSTRKNESLVQ